MRVLDGFRRWMEDGAFHDEHLHAPVLHGAPHVFIYVLRYVLRQVLRRVLHLLILHVSPKGKRGGRHGCVGPGFRRWKMTIDKTNTFTLPFSAAPSTYRILRHVLRHVPLVGDGAYDGGRLAGLTPRLMLHARVLALPLPAAGVVLEVSTPDSFAGCLDDESGGGDGRIVSPATAGGDGTAAGWLLLSFSASRRLSYN